MGELRLYAIGIDEVRNMIGASPQEQERLRGLAHSLLGPAVGSGGGGGLLSKLGPIFKRPPAAPVIAPTQPVPQDVDVLLAGAYVAPDRLGATWRVLETLVQGSAWGSTLVSLSPEALDELDFALASGGVSAAVGLHHLLNSPPSLTLLPVHGLTVGWHPYEKVLALAEAYRSALPQVKSQEQAELAAALAGWLDGFRGWAETADQVQRPAPDLLGFWAH